VILSKRRSVVSFLVSLLAAAAVTSGSGASAAVFSSTPPAIVTEGEGPITWAFDSDAPGTMWGHVTWRVSTEPEWHMCGGPSGAVTLEGLTAGTYWVEIADEVDLAFAGESLGVAPFTRCSQPQPAALGPLHPVALSVVTVVPQLVVSPAPTTIVVDPAPRPSGASRRCDAVRRRQSELEMAFGVDMRRMRRATTSARRDRWRTRLALDRSALRAARGAC
jgi:hypothetical protein